MGPFVPNPISDPLNLVVALVLGILFGAVLEQAGFSSSRRLVGVFYGYDFTVLRVFFTAAVTAMAGVLLLGSAGLLDTGAIFVNPTWLVPTLVGGAFMGVGFLLGGYCPGTSVCAAAIGKVDAMAFVGGGFLGVLGFAEAYPAVERFSESTSRGPVKVFASLGIPPGVFAFLLVAASVVAFVVASKVERRVSPDAAPSLRFPFKAHVLAGAALLAVGALLLFVPDHRARLLARAAARSSSTAPPVAVMSADELAYRIVDRDPRTLVVDLRPAAPGQLSLPGSVHASMNDLFGKELRPALGPRHVKKVVVADGEEQERTAALLLGELGYENVAVLAGAFPLFERTILVPAPPVTTGSRWDADVTRFRDSARPRILALAAAEKAKATAAPKKEKKIQGGC